MLKHKTGKLYLVNIDAIILGGKSRIAKSGPDIEFDLPCQPYVANMDGNLLPEMIRSANANLKTFTCFVYLKGRYMQVPDIERGNFFSNDVYIFLCVYHQDKKSDPTNLSSERRMSIMRSVNAIATEKEENDDNIFTSNSNDSENESVNEEENDSFFCVVYFWQGRNASKLAQSSFKFHTLGEMQTLVEKMYHCPIHVEYLNQHRESFGLLAHLDNVCVYHLGSRQKWLSLDKNEKKSKLYHIRKDLRYKTLRAIEVDKNFFNLISNDYFFLYTGVIDYLWVGSEASREDIDTLQDVIDLVQSLDLDELPEITVLKEGNESDDFWNLLNNPDDQDKSNSDIKTSLKISIKDRPVLRISDRRFIKCSCEAGFFQLEDIPFFTQNDLQNDNAVILMTEFVNYLWAGNQASQVLINRTLKIAETYNEKVEYIQQGKESDIFKAYFHGFHNISGRRNI